MNDESEEIAELRDQVQRLTSMIEELEQFLPQSSPVLLHPGDEELPSQTTNTTANTTMNRRGLLTATAVTASAVLGATALAATKTPIVHAATGDPVLLGQTNDTSAYSQLVGTTGSHPGSLLGVEDPDNTGANGIYVHVGSGSAITAGAGNGVDLYANGSGRIQLALAGFVGAPGGGNHTRGEIIRDANGTMYFCQESGEPGSWLKVATFDPNFVGGSISLFKPPFRVYDSRTHDGPLIGNTYRDIFFGSYGGMVGNLTVTNTTASGYLVICPSGAPAPGTSTVNYVKGQTNANSFLAAVGANGKVRIHNFGGGAADFVLDATGYIDSE